MASYSVLKKRLIKETILLSVIVVALTGGGLFLQFTSEDALTEQQAIEGDVGQIRAKLGELKRELNSGQEQVEMYNLYVKSHNKDFNLNREAATKWIANQREKYHLVNLSITIPPFSDVPKDAFPLKSGTMIKTSVKLSFGALTDNSIFAFIEAMQREMPGIAMIDDIKITYSGELNSSVLLDLTRRRISPVVTTELSFTWIGIRTDVKGAANAK